MKYFQDELIKITLLYHMKSDISQLVCTRLEMTEIVIRSCSIIYFKNNYERLPFFVNFSSALFKNLYEFSFSTNTK